jgi:glycerophosphoinositol glycerophosphodiesterase
MWDYFVYQCVLTCAVFTLLTNSVTYGLYLTSLLLSFFLYLKNHAPNKTNSAAVLKIDITSIIAHRCGGSDAPENTLDAIREASSNGEDGIEFDLEFTIDGVPILMHDETVDRTTDQSGDVRQMT